MAKLIHLKISVARSVDALPPSSAAFAPTTAKSNTNRILTAKKEERFRVIELLSRERRDAAGFPGCGARFRRKGRQRWLRRRGGQRQGQPPRARSRRLLRPRRACPRALS